MQPCLESTKVVQWFVSVIPLPCLYRYHSHCYAAYCRLMQNMSWKLTFNAWPFLHPVGNGPNSQSFFNCPDIKSAHRSLPAFLLLWMGIDAARAFQGLLSQKTPAATAHHNMLSTKNLGLNHTANLSASMSQCSKSRHPP